jgi:hypothetical protein
MAYWIDADSESTCDRRGGLFGEIGPFPPNSNGGDVQGGFALGD